MTRPRLGRFLVPTLLAIGTAALYLPRLQDAPVYPVRDEMYFGLTAHSLATSARDPSGLLMPVYFPIGPPGQPWMWFQPMLMYAIAIVVRVLPFTEGIIRLPMVAAGVADVVLMYLIAKVLFERELLAVAAAVLLALTPAHFVYSRFALDYQAPLPFILGWLLCLLRYCRHGQPRQLFFAGLLLGVGLYSYIGADILIPLYALLTCIVLYRRREPAARYALLAAGFMLPATLGVLFLLGHPAIIRDVVMRYDPNQRNTAGMADTVATFIRSRHLNEAAGVYLTFWNTQLLFIDGRAMMTGVAGVFLLPIAGAFVVGVVRALRHLNVVSVLLLVGLVSAPIPASFVNKPEAIRRALEVVPFVVLLAVYGLDYVWFAASGRVRRLAFIGVWCVVIYLADAYRDHLPHAQGFIRASTVPLVLAGLATLLRRVAVDRLDWRRIALVSVFSLGAMQAAYYAAGYGVVLYATFAMMAAIGLATVPRWTIADRDPVGPVTAIGLLAVVVSEFVYFHVDYGFVHRVAFIPASALLMVFRMVCSGAVLIAAIGLARVPRRLLVDRLTRTQQTAVALLMLAAIQIAYFHIDYFSDYRIRYVHASAVLLAAIGLTMLLKGIAGSRVRLGQFGTVALLVLVSIQFTPFYADYFSGFRMRRSNDPEARVSLVYDTLLERLRGLSVPAVYLSSDLDMPWLQDRDLFWRFYLLKHDREDLLSRTIIADASQLEGSRVRGLALGAVIVTTASRVTQAMVDHLVSAGDLKAYTLVKSIAGVPMYWILERSDAGIK